MMQQNTFTCIARGHGAPVLPATAEQWLAMRREPWLAQQCARNDQGHVLCTLPVKAPSLVRSGDQVVKDLQADDPLSPVAHFHEFLSHDMIMYLVKCYNLLAIDNKYKMEQMN